MTHLIRLQRTVTKLVSLAFLTLLTASAAAQDLAVGAAYSLAVDASGLTWEWGEIPRPGGGEEYRRVPRPVPDAAGTGELSSISAVSAANQALALASNGTVWSWRYNGEGQRGNGLVDSDAGAPPAQVLGAGGVGILTGIVEIAAGDRHSLALSSDGTVWAWGDEIYGELGNGVTSPDYSDLASPFPVKVLGPGGTGFLTNVTSIAAGNYFSLALRSDGTVWAWGSNNGSQLGGGTALQGVVRSAFPTQVAGPSGTGALTGVVRISAGALHGLAVKSDGTLWAWGSSNTGALGQGVGVNFTNQPAQVRGPGGTGFLTNVTDVDAGNDWSLARRSDETAWAFGAGDDGQLGNNGIASQPFPTQVLTPGGLAPLEHVAAGEASPPHRKYLAAGSSSFDAHSLLMRSGGNLVGFGGNFFNQLAVSGQNDHPVPLAICQPKLRPPTTPVVSCPGSVASGAQYVVSWTAFSDAEGYVVTIDGNEQPLTTETSLQWNAPVLVCPSGFATLATFQVRAVTSICQGADSEVCTVQTLPVYAGPPDSAPTMSCPSVIDAGAQFNIAWSAVSGATSYEIDWNDDEFPDHATADASELALDLTATSIGHLPFSARALNPCGAGPWATACDVRVRPDTSQCYSTGGFSICSSSFTEGPPGTFTTEGTHARLLPDGVAETDFTLWVRGTVEGIPAADELNFEGVAYMDTEYGAVDLLASADAVLEAHDGGPRMADMRDFDPTLPLIGGSRCPIPRNPLKWLEATFNCGMRTLQTQLPCIKKQGSKFSLDKCLPFRGDVKVWWQPITLNPLDPYFFYPSCALFEGKFGADDVPENPGFFATGFAAACPIPPRVVGLVSAEVRLAGCELATAGRLEHQVPTDATTPYGMRFDTTTLRCPTLGGLETDIDQVFVAPGIFDVPGGSFKLANVDALLFSIHDVTGTFAQRAPSSLGYRICAEGSALMRGGVLGLDAGVTLFDGDLQRACMNVGIPGLQWGGFKGLLSLDKLGGCSELSIANTPASDRCTDVTKVFPTVTPCLDCNYGTRTLRLFAEVSAGPPRAWNWEVADLVKLAPAEYKTGKKGQTLGGTVKVLGQKFGRGQVCLEKSAFEGCAAIDLFDTVHGDAQLALDKNGLSGSVEAAITAPVDIGFCPVCVRKNANIANVSAWLARFRADNRPELRYGVGTEAALFGLKAVVAMDVRTGNLYWTGVNRLSRQQALQLGGPQAVVANQVVTVKAGETQAIFGAHSDAGLPVITLTSPSAVAFDSGSPGTHLLQDADAGVTMLAVDAPEPGAWQMQVSGLPDGASVDIETMGEAVPATLAVTEPSSDGSSLHVAWNATVPEAAAPTVLRIYAATDDVVAAAGAGALLHEQPLTPGADDFDIPEGALSTGTWSLVLVTDDSLGHVVPHVAPGHVVVEDLVGPDAPTNVVVAALPDGLRVTWTPSASVDVEAHEVLISEAGALSGDLVEVANEDDRLDLHGLTPGVAYHLRVRAFDYSGNRGPEADAGEVSPDAGADGTAPATPTGLNLTLLSPTSARVAWTSVAGAATYLVHYGSDERLRGRLADQGDSPVEDSASPLDLTGLSAGHWLHVAVSAVDAAGNESSMSAIAKVLLTNGASADGDGVPDDWERTWLGDTEHSVGTGDSDADYLSDFEEMQSGTDPLVADPFAWGDVSPLPAGNGLIDVGDVVEGLRLAVGLDALNPDLLRRINLVPATITPGLPDLARPTAAEPRQVTVSDLILLLRAIVGLVELDAPLPSEE